MRIFIFLLLIAPLCSRAQQTANQQLEDLYQDLNNRFQSANAYKTTGFVEKYWRIAGNTGFNATVSELEKQLKAAGFKKQENSENEAQLTYRIEKRAMQKPTWEPVRALVEIAGDGHVVLESSSNRNMQVVNSGSTPDSGITAELVYVGRGTLAECKDKDLKGKIVLGEASASTLLRNTRSMDVAGVLSYSMPKYTRPTVNIHSIQFQQISMTDSPHLPWALAVSYAALQELKKQLTAGSTRVHVLVQTRIYPSEEYTVVANIRGEKEPDQRFVYSAHIQEPGANDNASGVGTLAEMARVAAALVREKKYHPQRTLTFLWGDEIRSTHRYITDDSIRAKGIHWGLSLDMVGEDASKTGGSFLIEKMPDPSAIWTRGNDHHTEWGGSVLKESDMFPHYFNDFVLARCRQQGQRNNWVVNSNPFEGGSDHTPFLQAHIPGLLMWHFTDQFYHTDGDRLDKVSPEEMQNVGVSALAVGLTLCNPTAQLFPAMVEELKQQAETRLETEYRLGKISVAQLGDRQQQAHILEVWGKWYVEAVASMQDIPTEPLTDAQKVLLQKAAASVKELVQAKAGQL